MNLKLIKVSIIILLVVLYMIIGFSCISKNVNKDLNRNLLKEDFEKYNYDIKIEYTYEIWNEKSQSYIWNSKNNNIILNNNIDPNSKNNQIESFADQRYYWGTINGISGIYDNNKRIVLSIDDIKKHTKLESSIYIYNLISDKNKNLLYFIARNSYIETINSYNLIMKDFNIIFSRNRGSKDSLKYIFNNNAIYTFDEKDELFKISLDTKETDYFGIKASKYIGMNDKLLCINNRDVGMFDTNSEKILNNFKTEFYVKSFLIDDNQNFIITEEYTPEFSLFLGANQSNTLGLDFTPKSVNQLVIYELSTGKYRVIAKGNAKKIIASYQLLEE